MWCTSPHTQRGAVTTRANVDSGEGDRKSTRLNSSHLVISYAVFCLKKKNNDDLDNNRSKQCHPFPHELYCIDGLRCLEQPHLLAVLCTGNRSYAKDLRRTRRIFVIY